MSENADIYPDTDIERTNNSGLSEPELKNLIQGLRMDDKPFMQRVRLGATIRQHNLGLKPAELLATARSHQTEQIMANEKGTLYHYHQTDLENLDDILKLGALMSYDSQKEFGATHRGAGSRPDVVQFTRDHYDKEGNLVKPGLVRAGSLGVSGDIALVFDEAIMKTPEYDSIVEYPNAPMASLDLLKAIAVTDENDLPIVRSAVAKQGLEAEVMTRKQWLDRMQPT